MIGRLIACVTRYIPRHYLHRIAVIIGKCVAQLLRGRRYTDPIDGFRYSILLPYGRFDLRVNALAPHSLSLERHRLIWLYLIREVGILSRSISILHVAPEWALLRQLEKLSNVVYITADLISPWSSIHCDIQFLPFIDNYFDLIICNHVLEHIPDDRLAMRELLRILAPGGQAILLVPQDCSHIATLEDRAINTPFLREKHYGQKDHLRLYGADYSLRLEQEGFVVETIHYSDIVGDLLCKKYAINLNDIIYIGRKSF